MNSTCLHYTWCQTNYGICSYCDISLDLRKRYAFPCQYCNEILQAQEIPTLPIVLDANNGVCSRCEPRHCFEKFQRMLSCLDLNDETVQRICKIIGENIQ